MKKLTKKPTTIKRTIDTRNVKNYSSDVIKNYSIEVAMINDINKRMGTELR